MAVLGGAGQTYLNREKNRLARLLGNRDVLGDNYQAQTDVSFTSIADIVANVNNDVGDVIVKHLGRFAASLAVSTNRRDRIARIHTIAGNEAINATSVRYENARKAAGGSGPKTIRDSKNAMRYAGGKLGKALKDPNMMLATWEGVSYVNVPYLDTVAKQWYRLNFGAQGSNDANSRPHGRHTIKFFGEAISAISLQELGPSKAFRIPTGFFVDVGGAKREFVAGTDYNLKEYKRGKTGWEGQRNFVKPQITKGIAGWAFLDAGAKQLADSLGDGYTVLWREWLDEAAEDGGKGSSPATLSGLSDFAVNRNLKWLKKIQRSRPTHVARFRQRRGY
jgi:hypothetical protein